MVGILEWLDVHEPARASQDANNGRVCARLSQIFDLFGKDSQLNVYAGELEVRPPLAVLSQVHG